MTTSKLSDAQNLILNVEIEKFSRLRSSSGVHNCVYFVDGSYLRIEFNSTLNKHWNDKTDEEFLVYVKSYLVKRNEQYSHVNYNGSLCIGRRR